MSRTGDYQEYLEGPWRFNARLGQGNFNAVILGIDRPAPHLCGMSKSSARSLAVLNRLGSCVTCT